MSKSGSSFATLDSSSESPGSLSVSPVSEDRRIKRKAFSDPAGKPSLKSLRLFYNDEYRQLYNEVIDELGSAPYSMHEPLSLDGMNDASWWTSDEKERFFHALTRKGRHDIKGIASEIQSKSEPEVFQYIELLRKGLVSSELSYRRPGFVMRPEFDAALEISPDCTTALEQCAGALSILRQAEEEKIERRTYDNLWLLTPQIGRWADKCLKKGNGDDNSVSQSLPAAVLLNLGQFLHLSKIFFMNSSDMDYNWRSYTGKRMTPTLMNTAFSDFYNLATSITKRLVISSQSFAESRLRAQTSSEYQPRRHVRKQDVFAALDTLRMQRNAKTHWVGVARKCKLRVFEKVKHSNRNPDASGKRYSYDEVEDFLQSNMSVSAEDGLSQNKDDMREFSKSGTVLDFDSGSEPYANPETTDDGGDDDGDDDAAAAESLLSSICDEESLSREEIQEQLEDGYWEGQDQKKNQVEEARLWKLLGEDPSKKMRLEERNEKQKAPTTARKERLDLVDWTLWTDYGAEWETSETPVLEKAFIDNRRVNKVRVVGRQAAKPSTRARSIQRDHVSEEESTSGMSSGRDEDEDEDEKATDAMATPASEEGSSSDEEA